MRLHTKILGSALLLAFAGSALAQSKNPHVDLKETKLANGLRVITVEDHNAPVIAVNVTYNVGSRNEKPGRTGFAHLFEHMMFQKSKHVAEDAYFRTLEAAGASEINGTTDQDRTNYFETVPSNQLELGRNLVEKNNIQKLTSCSTCHR